MRYESSLIASLDEHPDEGREIPGSAAFIGAFLNDPDWGIAIATGNWRRIAAHKLHRARISCTDRPLACADDATTREGLLELAMTRARKHYGMEFDLVVSVGDAPWDARAAAALGVPFIGVGSRWSAEAQLPCAGSILDYQDPRAVTTLFTSLC
jgi:phosphoglycolate phosphatase-like HAD superfamily hydrolase